MSDVAASDIGRQSDPVGHSGTSPGLVTSPSVLQIEMTPPWARPAKRQVWSVVQGNPPTQGLYVTQDRGVSGQHPGNAQLRAPDVAHECGCLTGWPGKCAPPKNLCPHRRLAHP